jgi:hypothetical protein
MNDEGKGEANYLFGNPIGSFLYTCVNGLFGLQLQTEAKRFHVNLLFLNIGIKHP